MKNIIKILFLFSIALSSCVTVQQTKLKVDDTDVPPIFITNRPTKPYLETTYFEVSGSIFHSNKKLLKNLKEKAKKDGVDALVDVKFGYIFWWPKVTGTGIKYLN